MKGDIEALVQELRTRRWTLACAESCTGGLVASEITRLAGVSDVFVGGVVSYSNDLKMKILGVAADDLRAHGAVSENVARQMARGAVRELGASCAVAITGIAGPTGGSIEKPVGTVWLSACGPGFEVSERQLFAGDRRAIQDQAARTAVLILLREVRKSK